MVAEVGVRVCPCPSAENLGKRGRLAAAGGKIPLQHEYERHVTLTGEVGNVLGDDDSRLCSSERRGLSVLGRSKSALGYVDGVLTVDLPQDFRGGGREHLIDQETPSREQCLTLPGQGMATRGQRTIALDPLSSLIRMGGRIVQRNADQSRMKIRFSAQRGDSCFL
jgi:hypothetical protein